jgi:hypothetical protein
MAVLRRSLWGSICMSDALLSRVVPPLASDVLKPIPKFAMKPERRGTLQLRLVISMCESACARCSRWSPERLYSECIVRLLIGHLDDTAMVGALAPDRGYGSHSKRTACRSTTLSSGDRSSTSRSTEPTKLSGGPIQMSRRSVARRRQPDHRPRSKQARETVRGVANVLQRTIQRRRSASRAAVTPGRPVATELRVAR